MSRYVLCGPQGIWDRHRKCWVVWQGTGGGWYSTKDFEDLAMSAINSDPACLAYDRQDVEHEYIAGEDGCRVCGEGVCHYVHRDTKINSP